jgi:hypothetical protein
MSILRLWKAINTSKPPLVPVILPHIHINVVIEKISQRHINPPSPKHSKTPSFSNTVRTTMLLSPSNHRNLSILRLSNFVSDKKRISASSIF